MRSAIIAAFAAGALAVPLQERGIVYETDIVYATQYVTVTQGDVAPTPDPAPVPTTSAKKNHLHGHRKPQNYAWTSSWATTWTEAAPAPSSEAEQQAPAYSEPAPAPSSYEAPAPSSYAEPTSTKAQSSAPASSASDSKPTGYQGKVLHHHNIHRANHSAPDLTWSDSLASTAQEIGNSCVYAHDKSKGDGNYGQNIAAGVKADNVSAVITELFYNGEVALFEGQYGKADPDMANFEEWGHFSQIVWKDTTEVGCATVDCTDKGLANTGGNVPPYFTVCNYKSAGNFAGEYADNVLESRGDKTCYWNDAE